MAISPVFPIGDGDGARYGRGEGADIEVEVPAQCNVVDSCAVTQCDLAVMNDS